MDKTDTLTERIKDYIKKNKITRRMFADRAGIDCMTLIRGLKGQTKFKPETAEKIKQVLKGKKVVLAGQYEGCNPPQSCFTCPLPDCTNNRLSRKEETLYNQAGWAKDYVETVDKARSNLYDTTLHFCCKHNLLM